MNITINNEELTLLADRALFWPRTQTLLAADLHLGKANHFQVHGLPVPDPAAHDLARLSHLLRITNATHLYLLGDLFHASSGITSSLINCLDDFLAKHRDVSTTLVRGNHDPRSPRLPTELPVRLEDHVDLAPFHLVHQTTSRPSKSRLHTIAGHLHPAVSIRPQTPNAKSLVAPCFHITPSHTILPAFGSFTGTHPVSPSPQDRVIAAADNALTEIPKSLWRPNY